jgi:hypothetical protein
MYLLLLVLAAYLSVQHQQALMQPYKLLLRDHPALAMYGSMHCP